MQVNSPKELENELKLINSKFVDKETEQNWSDRELSLQRLRGLIRGNCISMKLFAENLKSLMDLRSALVLTSSTVIAEFSTILQDQLDPLADMILPVLVKLSGSSKKLISVKIIHTTKIFWSFITWQPKHFAVLNTSINDKGPMVRQAAAEMLKLSLEKIHNDATLQTFVEKSNILDILQKMFKRSLVDSEVMVRNLSRDAFYYFNTIWPDMAIQIVDSLDNSARKAIAKTPKPTRTMLQLPEINCADGIPLEINQIDMVEEMDDEDTVDSVEADEEFDEERIIVELQNKTKDSISILLDFIRTSLDKDVAKPIFSPDASLQVKQILTDLYSDSLYTNDHMANFINLDSIKLFVEAKLLTLEGLLVPMILVNSSTDDELIKNDFEAFKYYLQSELEATDILTTLLNSIPKIGMSGFRVKKNIKTRKIEQQAKEYILSWVSSMVDTVVCEDHDVDVIMVRLIMDRVVPVLCTQGKTEASVESAKHILMAIHQLSPSDFLKKLDTFDFEMSGIIRETCHISEDLPDEDEQMQEEAQMVEEFSEQIFDEISGNDESLPHDFEGVSYSCDEVSQDNDSVSGDFDMCNQIDQATPKKFNGHMKQVEFDEVNVREGPSGLVRFTEDESEITSSIKPPSLEALQHFVDHPATPKRMYEDPFQNADDFKELGKTPKQYRFSNQRDELGQLIGQLETEQNILPIISRLYALSRKFKYTLTDMTGADYWECHFETLINFLMDQLAPQGTTMTNQEQYLMLLNQLICNQTCMLSGMETNLLLLLFSCRSDGTEEISGSADFALLSLARVYPCQVLLDQVLSLVCEHWNLDDPDNDAYAIRTSAKLLQINQAFKPTPFASSLYLIGKLAVESGNIQETVFINSIVPIIKNALEHPSISIRKAGYECLVDFAIAFEQTFWSITTHSFTTDQLRIVHCLKAQIQSHR
ncbi:suppressor of tub2 mutation [Globomyces sp. JEL0801]|nr:suppressor of tub2 mutation [Globomyces sp. JEL0801]